MWVQCTTNIKIFLQDLNIVLSNILCMVYPCIIPFTHTQPFWAHSNSIRILYVITNLKSWESFCVLSIALSQMYSPIPVYKILRSLCDGKALNDYMPGGVSRESLPWITQTQNIFRLTVNKHFSVVQIHRQTGSHHALLPIFCRIHNPWLFWGQIDSFGILNVWFLCTFLLKKN